MFNDSLAFVRNQTKASPPSCASFFNQIAGEKLLHFHTTLPGYAETPLIELKQLAEHLGVGSIYVKDESHRFGLNSFKGLGASAAVGSWLSQISATGLDYNKLVSQRMWNSLGKLTFVTATDGNHGRGLAWAAKIFGHSCVVFLPKGTAYERLRSIQALGATVQVLDFGYDDCVQYAKQFSMANGYVLIQDVAWKGYESIPLLIMQGYTTMAYEALMQLNRQMPTHIFLQAGVGSMAAAVASFFCRLSSSVKPTIVIAEPDGANCLYRTASANDGKLHSVSGNIDTIMSGLNCGTPSSLAWELLHCYADFFASMSDSLAAKGMRVLSSPLEGDRRIISGESGAATVGLVYELLTNDSYRPFKELLGLNGQSRILCFSTEGATDKAGFRRMVWDAEL